MFTNVVYKCYPPFLTRLSSLLILFSCVLQFTHGCSTRCPTIQWIGWRTEMYVKYMAEREGFIRTISSSFPWIRDGKHTKSEVISLSLFADWVIRGLQMGSTLKSEVIIQCLLADRFIRGLKMGWTLRVRSLASVCWLQSYQRTEDGKHTKSEVISHCLLADRVIRGLKMGSTLRVRSSAGACWLTVL